VQCRADADEGPQDAGQGQVGRAVVEVPAVARVVGQPGKRGRLGQQPVEPLGPEPFGPGVDHLEPAVEEPVHLGHVVVGRRAVDHDPLGEAAGREFLGRARPVGGQRDGQADRILAVRVQMHKTITADWPT
jgi:hypothetical protein